MLATLIFLQLTLWVASIHAFYPFIPQWQCEENHICEDGTKSSKPKPRSTVTYKLSQRARNVRARHPIAFSASEMY
jgi:hypothetical protein